MSLDKLYGTWHKQRDDSKYQWLWHRLAHQPEAPGPCSGLSQRKNEIIELWRLFVALQPKVIVEIGTAQGGSLAAWCQLAPRDATIISIDRCVDDCRPRPGDPVHPDIYNGPLKMTSQGGGAYSLRQHAQQLHVINGWSYEPAVLQNLERLLAGRKIDWLYHDASHEASMFAKDWELYWPLVADGGVFAAHDIAPSADPKCNKKEFWDVITGRKPGMGTIDKPGAEYSACYEFHPPPGVTEMGSGLLIK
jgi:predicted O-methyltransferase YrrM